MAAVPTGVGIVAQDEELSRLQFDRAIDPVAALGGPVLVSQDPKAPELEFTALGAELNSLEGAR